jgi:hypothetical protein
MQKTHMLKDPQFPFKHETAVCGVRGIAAFIWSKVDCKRCLKKKPAKRKRR